jgi:hypothetical protein
MSLFSSSPNNEVFIIFCFWFICDFFSSHLADKPWLKVPFADLLWEKNTAEWLADSVDKLTIDSNPYSWIQKKHFDYIAWQIGHAHYNLTLKDEIEIKIMNMLASSVIPRSINHFAFSNYSCLKEDGIVVTCHHTCVAIMSNMLGHV